MIRLLLIVAAFTIGGANCCQAECVGGVCLTPGALVARVAHQGVALVGAVLPGQACGCAECSCVDCQCGAGTSQQVAITQRRVITSHGIGHHSRYRERVAVSSGQHARRLFGRLRCR